MTQLISNPDANLPPTAMASRVPGAEASRIAGRSRFLSRAAGPRERLFCLLLTLLVASSATSALAQSSEKAAPKAPLHDTWYGTTISQSATGFVITSYWSKGVNMRSEIVIAGRRIVTIVTPKLYYTLDLTRGIGLGIERSELARAGDATRARPFGDEKAALLRGGGEFVGEETLAKQQVDLYRLTNDTGRVQVWVTKGTELPVRVERWHRESGRRDHVDYIDWLRGFPIDESFFEPPGGLDLEIVEYGDYVSRAMSERLGPAPPLYAHLLHGEARQYDDAESKAKAGAAAQDD